jgi:hypothetical protein
MFEQDKTTSTQRVTISLEAVTELTAQYQRWAALLTENTRHQIYGESNRQLLMAKLQGMSAAIRILSLPIEREYDDRP